jgi:hypothetical protein
LQQAHSPADSRGGGKTIRERNGEGSIRIPVDELFGFGVQGDLKLPASQTKHHHLLSPLTNFFFKTIKKNIISQAVCNLLFIDLLG